MSKARAQKDFQDEFEFHQHEWLVERIGWFALLALIIAALLGIFGDGPLSSKTVGDTRTATLEYDRFVRYAAPTVLELTVSQARPRPIAIEVNEAYLRDFAITSIVPSPRSATLVGDRHRFEFELEGSPATIAIRLTPEKIGRKHGSFSVAGTQLDIAQFVYP